VIFRDQGTGKLFTTAVPYRENKAVYFLRRLPGGIRLFVTYQWGKPQLDEVENAEGAVIPHGYVT